MLANQLIRSGTSPGAQFSEARRAKSKADFVSKIQGALQELEETSYWLDLVIRANPMLSTRLHDLRVENEELIKILTSIVLKVKRAT